MREAGSARRGETHARKVKVRSIRSSLTIRSGLRRRSTRTSELNAWWDWGSQDWEGGESALLRASDQRLDGGTSELNGTGGRRIGGRPAQRCLDGGAPGYSLRVSEIRMSLNRSEIWKLASERLPCEGHHLAQKPAGCWYRMLYSAMDSDRSFGLINSEPVVGSSKGSQGPQATSNIGTLDINSTH